MKEQVTKECKYKQLILTLENNIMLYNDRMTIQTNMNIQ